MKLIVHRDAESDVRDAHSWYEGKRLGLGREFMDEVDATFARVLEAPQSFAVVYSGMRRAVLTRFPYIVYFRDVDVEDAVYGVLHGRRNRRVLRERSTSG